MMKVLFHSQVFLDVPLEGRSGAALCLQGGCRAAVFERTALLYPTVPDMEAGSARVSWTLLVLM